MDSRYGTPTAEMEYDTFMDSLVEMARGYSGDGEDENVRVIYRSAQQIARDGDKRLNEIERLSARNHGDDYGQGK